MRSGCVTRWLPTATKRRIEPAPSAYDSVSKTVASETAAPRAQHADRREHGPGARHEDKAETDAKKKRAAITDATAAHEGERALDHQGEARKHERGCQHKQHPDREIAEQVLREPSAARSAPAVSVNVVKLTTRPAMIANAPRRPSPAALPAKTIGSTGSTHGERAVITPAMNPIANRRITG